MLAIVVLGVGGLAVLLTITPAPSATADPAVALTLSGVMSNSQWNPYTRDFDGVKMVLVPRGCFVMGNNSGPLAEQPAHKVCFDRPFWIDVTEVTQAQFTRLGGKADRANVFSGDNLPRENVTWFEADAFCKKRRARLPTEAQWEYAARGLDGLIFPWGNSLNADAAIYNGNSGGHSRNVGSKPGGVSWVGAYDLSGNVWEWVNDWYTLTYYATLPDGVVNPQGPSSVASHGVRGGFWDITLSLVRASRRSPSDPTSASGSTGFRCSGGFAGSN